MHIPKYSSLDIGILISLFKIVIFRIVHLPSTLPVVVVTALLGLCLGKPTKHCAELGAQNQQRKLVKKRNQTGVLPSEELSTVNVGLGEVLTVGHT